MANANNRERRVVVAGALAAAALCVPVMAILGASDASISATNGKCLAWFGSRDDGICMGYSTGNGINVGTPDIGVYGPGSGLGVSSGPLLPGQTFNQGITP
jgi:hypothetical protein